MQQEQQKKLNKEEHTENLNVFENRVHRKSSPFKITEAGSGETPVQLLQLALVTCWLLLKSHFKKIETISHVKALAEIYLSHGISILSKFCEMFANFANVSQGLPEVC